jgi:hypothetical protein
MRVAWVGGIERSERALEAAASRAGHELEFHSGDVHGRGAEELEGVVSRCDLVVVVTSVNSHGGVAVAKKAARRLGRPLMISRGGSVSVLERLLREAS